MSHSGTLLVVRNVGPSACRLDPNPQLTFRGSDGKEIATTFTVDTPFNRGPVANGQHLPMGHGPVIVPIVLAGNAEATARLRWVSGDVYDHGVCVSPGALLFKIGNTTLTTPLHAQMCGPDAAHLGITTTRLALDPMYHPSE